MPDVLDPERLAVWRAFLEAHKAVYDVLGHELEADGVPHGYYDAYVHLSEAPDGRLAMHDLADRLLVHKSNVTRLIDRMEADGLVERQPCPSDRRVVHVALTPAGRAELRRAAPAHLAGIQEHFAQHLTDQEVKVLGRAMRKILEANRPERAAFIAGRASADATR